MISYASLATPWLPAEVVTIKGEQQAAYVLDRDGEIAIILTANGRELMQVEQKALDGEYCQKGSRWLSESAVTLLAKPRYSPCPD